LMRLSDLVMCLQIWLSSIWAKETYRVHSGTCRKCKRRRSL
jgi:hypothetical protein